MENILLFVLTVFLYSAIWIWLSPPGSFGKYVKRVALIALLSVPININGRVFTVIGNAAGEKSVFSVFSLYQRADGDAVTFLGLSGYQRAGNNAVTGAGISGYQRAGNEAVTILGLSGYQRAGNAQTIVGIAFYQNVEGNTRAFGVGSMLKHLIAPSKED